MDTKHSFEKAWENGVIHDQAPKWAKYRKRMVSEFQSPYRSADGKDPLAEAIAKAVKMINNLRPEPGGPAYLGTPELTYSYPDVKNVKISEKGASIDQVTEELVNLFNGAPNWASPLTMCNVIPQANTASVIASILPQIFTPNTLEGEYAWNVHRSEMESAGMLANLIGWNPVEAGCVYTWGGGGCWTYAVKYGLTRVLHDSRYKGVRTNAKVLCSQQSHYVQQNATDWTGLGMDNIIRIRTVDDTNQMDLAHLEEVMKELRMQNIPVAAVVCTMGTTDASAFDPVAEVRAVMDRHPNAPEYGKAVLYADAVVGWSWVYFKEYDFAGNPLEFSPHILNVLKENGEKLKGIEHADAIGVDFHKVGWSPYASSCFLYKNAGEFEGILRRGSDAYLQVRTPYNPMYYTLEVSRSAQGALAGWATLKYFGMEGMQAILGGILEQKYYLYDLLETLPDMVCADPENTGFITLIRVYPKGVDAKHQYQKELNNPAVRDELVKHNELTLKIGNKLWNWYREAKQVNGRHTPYMSFSTGFRTTNYNRSETDPEAVVYALKSFPMNVHITPDMMRHVIDSIYAARDEVLGE